MAKVPRFSAVAITVTALGGGCMQGGALGSLGAVCPALQGSVDPLELQYSANARANAKVRAFVGAARDLVDVSIQAERAATEACVRMARDLGVQSAPSRDSEPGAGARDACGALAARIDEILRMGIRADVAMRPPACQADLQARAHCQGACDVQLDPGEIVARCDPGRLSGYCAGECTGACEGTCRGDCSGSCAVRDASGRCAGRCQGTCRGQCDATCHAACRGQWQAPRCEGYVQPPSADAECNASCNARAELRAQCQPAQVSVRINQNAEVAARLAATLQANLPELLHAELALGQRVAPSARTLVQVGAELPNVMGEAGAQAIACVAAAGQASVQASARIDVTIRASASVTGQVGVRG